MGADLHSTSFNPRTTIVATHRGRRPWIICVVSSHNSSKETMRKLSNSKRLLVIDPGNNLRKIPNRWFATGISFVVFHFVVKGRKAN